jgi:hypothetical protein
VTKVRGDTDIDVDRCVAEIAARMTERLPELVSIIQHALEEDIPELRGDALTIELLGASVEGNVNTLLRAPRYHSAVERVEAPTAALECARRLAQHGVPVNALVRAYRLGQRRLNDLVFAEVRSTDIEPLGKGRGRRGDDRDLLRVHRLDLATSRRGLRGRTRAMA